MGRITRDVFGNGFTYRDDSGKTTHYSRNVCSRGYTGSDGSHVDEHVFDTGFTVRDSHGRTVEKFTPKIFGRGYSGDNGTSIDPDVFNGYGASVNKRKW